MLFSKNIAADEDYFLIVDELRKKIAEIRRVAPVKLIDYLIVRKEEYETYGEECYGGALVAKGLQHQAPLFEQARLYFRLANDITVVLNNYVYEMYSDIKRRDPELYHEKKNQIELSLNNHLNAYEYGEGYLYLRIAFCDYLFSNYQECLRNLAGAFDSYTLCIDHERFRRNMNLILNVIYTELIEYENGNDLNFTLNKYTRKFVHYLKINRLISSYLDFSKTFNERFEERIIALNSVSIPLTEEDINIIEQKIDNYKELAASGVLNVFIKESIYDYIRWFIEDIIRGINEENYDPLFFRSTFDIITSLNQLGDLMRIIKKHNGNEASVRKLIDYYNENIANNELVERILLVHVQTKASYN